MINTPIVSPFRQFCQEKWFEHRDEIYAWTGQRVDYDSAYYFGKHRWLLKNMYLEQRAQDHAGSIQKSIQRSLRGGNI